MKNLELAKGDPQMYSPPSFSTLPTWFVLVVTLVLSLLSVEMGYRRARKKQRRAKQEDEKEKEAPVGAMVGRPLPLQPWHRYSTG
ncbi:hypothetical protein A9R05_39470 (plasmid) [Burkholderia sp. KK1]|nr:hypothetical protein A9R05_39470 [Burkholderia sp. KK1]